MAHKTARQILEMDLPYPDSKEPDYYKKWEERRVAEKAREEITDEIAYARVLARRGKFPDGAWPHELDDPRREAWRLELWKKVKTSLAGTKFDRDLDKDPGAAFAGELVNDIEVAMRALALLNSEYQDMQTPTPPNA